MILFLYSTGSCSIIATPRLWFILTASVLPIHIHSSISGPLLIPTCVFVLQMGQVPPTEVKRLMVKTGKKQSINKFQLQPMGSDSCGWWAVAAAQSLGAGIPLADFILHFDLKDPPKNDRILASMFSYPSLSSFHPPS